MTAQQLVVPLSGGGPAVLTLPQPLTKESLTQLEQSLAGRLAELRRNLGSDATDPGNVEYESWMQYLRPVSA